MSNYITDRKYTEYIHENIALPKLYKKLGWEELKVNKDQLDNMDVYNAVDHIFRDSKGRIFTVQERFREKKYSCYSDFTIRYRRDLNFNRDRVKSEFYKMDNVNCFTYGITNCSKDDLGLCTDFEKVAVINLSKVYDKIHSGLITIEDNGWMTSRIVGEKLVCPVKWNHDGSSSFIPIDIPSLVKLWGEDTLLFEQGF